MHKRNAQRTGCSPYDTSQSKGGLKLYIKVKSNEEEINANGFINGYCINIK